MKTHLGFVILFAAMYAASAMGLPAPTSRYAIDGSLQLIAPSSHFVTEDTLSPLHGISIAEAGSSALALVLSVPAGSFSASPSGGVSINGSDTSTLTMTGTQSALNAYLGGTHLFYLTGADATADVTLSLQVTEQGGSGQTASASTLLHVDAQPDADVGVAIDNVADFVNGGATTHYFIDVHNIIGDTQNLFLTTSSSANLSGFSWTCVGNGASCPAPAGSGAISASFVLPGDTALMFDLQASVAANPENPTVLTASLQAVLILQDPTPDDHIASDTNTVGIFRAGFE
ncbi:MAG: hypothetical protein ABI411_14900 [Tahibacter sp.]